MDIKDNIIETQKEYIQLLKIYLDDMADIYKFDKLVYRYLEADIKELENAAEKDRNRI